MITCRSPNAMTVAEQIAEIAEILGLAYLRLHRKELELSPDHEALCRVTADVAGEVAVKEAVA